MKDDEKKEIKYFSMFTGVGGFELGIERTNNSKSKIQEYEAKQDCSNISGNDVERTSFSCIGFSEIDKYANELLKDKFPDVKNYGDATKINPNELPDFDLLVGGFPCQAFSIAGKRKGFEDTRGTLFYEIARIIKVKRPNYLLLENVKGLLSHDRGRTFGTIISTLSELGYVVQWMVLNSKFFGVPQNRERVFIIGSLRGERIPEILPFKSSSRENPQPKEGKISSAISTGIPQHRNDGFYIKGEPKMIHNVYGGFGEGIRESDISPTLRTPKGGGHLPMVREVVPQSQIVKGTKGVSSTINAHGGGQGAKTGLYQVAPTLHGFKHGSHKHFNEILPKRGLAIRRLTPIECERLQGFPDNWTEGFSDTQRYRMMGNAVTVNVIKAIMEKLIK